MHLSRLILDPRNRQVQSDLRNPYDLHRTMTFGWAIDLMRQSRQLTPCSDDRRKPRRGRTGLSGDEASG